MIVGLAERSCPRRYPCAPDCCQILRHERFSFWKDKHDPKAIRRGQCKATFFMGRLCGLGPFREFFNFIYPCIILSFFQVMFTADLKSFADYNTTPSSSPQKKASTPKRKREDQLKEEDLNLPSPPLTPGLTTLTKAAVEVAAALAQQSSGDPGADITSVAERVKRRRSAKWS